jgi:hypothetical protein
MGRSWLITPQKASNEPAKKDPPKESKAIYNSATSVYTNTADPALQVFEYVAKDAAATVPKYAAKVPNSAASILKVVKAAKIGGYFALATDVGTNLL